MSTDCPHCLRAEFTLRLAQGLSRDHSYNLIGAAEQGRERVLEDLRSLAPAGTRVLLANMRTHKESLHGLLENLGGQLQLAAAPADFAQFVAALDADGGAVWLLLDHFDAMLDNPQLDPAYDVRFFDHLNNLKNHHVALLCATSKPHEQSGVVISGKFHSNSWLDLEAEHLAALSFRQLAAEIRRQRPTADDASINALAQHLENHSQVYDLLQFCLKAWADSELEQVQAEQINEWHKRYQAQRRPLHSGGLLKACHKLNRYGQNLAIATGFNRLAMPFKLSLDGLRWLANWLSQKSDKPASNPKTSDASSAENQD